MKIPSLLNIICTLLLVILGAILIGVATYMNNSLTLDWPLFLSTLGSFLALSAILSFWFENYARQNFFDQIMDNVSKSETFREAGLIEFFINSKDKNYSNEIRHGTTITTLFTYNSNFIKTYSEEIEYAINNGASVSLYFLKRNSSILDIMRDRGWQSNAINAAYETIAEFEARHADNDKVKVLYYDAIPRYSVVHVDQSLYVIEHTTSSGRTHVPALKLSVGGRLGEFYLRDIKRLTANEN